MLKKLKKRIKKQVMEFNDNVLPKYCYKSDLKSSIYYAFFSSAFRREHRAVLSGKVKHIQNEHNYYLLVRNTHRIEKGLLMRPRREVFALDYIEETVNAFVQTYNDDNLSQNTQMIWFKDVLGEYFSVVKPNDKLLELKEKYNKILLTEEFNKASTQKIPYSRRVEEFSNITFDNFLKLTKQRRSVRWFKDQKVSRELIDKAILAANQSPSACNRQPFEYRIIDNPDQMKEIIKLPMGTRGYGHNIPVMIVVVGNLDAYFSERDRHLIYIDASLANMSCMLALETLGLSSCSINWPDIEVKERKMEKFLKLESYQRPIMCLAVGYPDHEGMVAYSEKRNLDDIRKYNF